MMLRLIGPEEEYEIDYWMEDLPPSVIYNNNAVWVMAANSRPGEGVYRYYQQARGRYVPEAFMRKVEKNEKRDNEDPTVRN